MCVCVWGGAEEERWAQGISGYPGWEAPAVQQGVSGTAVCVCVLGGEGGSEEEWEALAVPRWGSAVLHKAALAVRPAGRKSGIQWGGYLKVRLVAESEEQPPPHTLPTLSHTSTPQDAEAAVAAGGTAALPVGGSAPPAAVTVAGSGPRDKSSAAAAAASSAALPSAAVADLDKIRLDPFKVPSYGEGSGWTAEPFIARHRLGGGGRPSLEGSRVRRLSHSLRGSVLRSNPKPCPPLLER